MTTLVLGAVALTSLVLSFAFAAFALVQRDGAGKNAGAGASSTQSTSADLGGVSETTSRILSEVERLAVLRERGSLSDKEFAAQTGRLFQRGDASQLPQRRRASATSRSTRTNQSTENSETPANL